jgi:Methyltransferase domain
MMFDLLKQIESTQHLPGWCSLEKAKFLAATVLMVQPETSVEIGVFAGRSFFPIALAHKFLDKGVAIAIEPWKNTAAAEGYTGENKLWWTKAVDMNKIQIQFIEEWKRLELELFIKVVQMKSDDYKPPTRIGLLHVDGQHTDQALRDVQRFGPHVAPNGIVVLDDLNWKNDGVCHVPKAVEWLLQNNFRETHRVFNKAEGGMDDYAAFKKRSGGSR